MVGNIEYTKFLNDEDWLPKKLEGLYVASMNAPFNRPSITNQSTSSDGFPLIPRDMASVLLNNRQNTETATPPTSTTTSTEQTDTPATTSTSTPTSTTNNEPVNAPAAPITPAAPVAVSSSFTPTYIKTGKSGINLNRARYWFKEFDKYGMNPLQKIALIVAMDGECGLNPIGSVNKRELNEGLNTKGGWAHAGEAAFGLTHWSTKKKYIDLYNADPRRQGPKLSNIESEYANPNARHVANLSDEDHGLLTSIYYKPLIDRTKGETDLRNLVADFYLQKAGRGNVTGNTVHEKAVAKGEAYMRSHAKQGFTKASKTNQYLKSLDKAFLLAAELGVQV